MNKNRRENFSTRRSEFLADSGKSRSHHAIRSPKDEFGRAIKSDSPESSFSSSPNSHHYKRSSKKSSRKYSSHNRRHRRCYSRSTSLPKRRRRKQSQTISRSPEKSTINENLSKSTSKSTRNDSETRSIKATPKGEMPTHKNSPTSNSQETDPNIRNTCKNETETVTSPEDNQLTIFGKSGDVTSPYCSSSPLRSCPAAPTHHYDSDKEATGSDMDIGHDSDSSFEFNYSPIRTNDTHCAISYTPVAPIDYFHTRNSSIQGAPAAT